MSARTVSDIREDLIAEMDDMSKKEEHWQVLREQENTDVNHTAAFIIITSVLVAVCVFLYNALFSNVQMTVEHMFGYSFLIGMGFVVSMIIGVIVFGDRHKEYAPGIHRTILLYGEHDRKLNDLRWELAEAVIPGHIIRMVRDKSNSHTHCYLASVEGEAREFYVSFDLDEIEYKDGVRAVPAAKSSNYAKDRITV